MVAITQVDAQVVVTLVQILGCRTTAATGATVAVMQNQGSVIKLQRAHQIIAAKRLKKQNVKLLSHRKQKQRCACAPRRNWIFVIQQIQIVDVTVHNVTLVETVSLTSAREKNTTQFVLLIY